MKQSAKKFLMFVSCILLDILCGTLYLYSAFSPQFSSRLNYSATQASALAMSGNLGNSIVGPIAGFFVDQFGFSIPISFGSIIFIGSYYLLKRQFDESMSNFNFSMVILFGIGLGGAFIYSGCLKCSAIIYPNNRGMATSIPIAFIGLSALFYSALASTFYPGDTSGLLGFLYISAIVIFLITIWFIIIADRFHQKINVSHSNNHSLDGLHDITNFDTNHISVELFKNKKFWLLCFIVGLLASIGQMYIFSLGFLVKALYIKKLLPPNTQIDDPLTVAFVENSNTIIQNQQNFEVGLLSISNSVGRLLSGIMGDLVILKFKKSRSVLIILPIFLILNSQIFCYILDDISYLYIATLTIGLAYGFTWGLFPSITMDFFGMENFSLNWGILATSGILPAYFYNILFGRIYDSNMKIINVLNSNITADTNDTLRICELGHKCYNDVFLWSVGGSLIMIILFFSLFYFLRRERKELYQKLENDVE
ncbi:MFS general substrate transporter [Ascoidea rubescens DSM 1968]|uniref:MFS general substrate transporter n=1 Tax=Ascoidea rubescens DSM 1968 TaxID=1344418 RepID=A0A1D2VFV6_9ASCO|nr:MFS general substrate transporter [Ascoidea rubescens DSM 1968]ODV60564.1 MFS general substrate transporter [Ascoidea rubescens DSM 1968]